MFIGRDESLPEIREQHVYHILERWTQNVPLVQGMVDGEWWAEGGRSHKAKQFKSCINQKLCVDLVWILIWTNPTNYKTNRQTKPETIGGNKTVTGYLMTLRNYFFKWHCDVFFFKSYLLIF